MNNEKLKIVERKESEKLEIVERKESEKQLLIHNLEKALRLERVCNLRGALEYVRSQVCFIHLSLLSSFQILK